MVKTVSERRNISEEKAQSMAAQLYHPQDALKNRLIDEIGTFEEFAMKHYPKHNVEDFVFRRDSSSKPPTLHQSEVNTLKNCFEMLSMPQIPMMTIHSPIMQCLDELLPLLEARMSS